MNEFSQCPHCGGRDKEQVDVTVVGPEVFVTYDCENCGKRYERIYVWLRNEKEPSWVPLK